MDADSAFEDIRNDIKDEKYDMVLPRVKAIADNCGNDLQILFKCASLLKVVEEEEYCQELLDRIESNLPSDEKDAMNTAIGLRGLGRCESAYIIINGFTSYEPDPYELALTAFTSGRPDEALRIIDDLELDDQRSMILNTDALAALGRYDEAMAVADKTIHYYGSSYATLVNKCNIMFRMGNPKEAIRFSKAHVKESKANMDYLALNAYVMRINGRLPAAVNYASRVLKNDFKHIGALETMAMCLIEKKSFINAKLLAGAINDADPGNPAAVRILDACRLMSS